MRTLSGVLGLVAALASAAAAQDTSFDWVKIGNPGNTADPVTGHGAVDYEYYMSTTEVTNAQYAQFLNAVDPNGTNAKGLWHPFMQQCLFPPQGCTAGIRKTNLGPGFNYEVIPGHEYEPVTYVSWYGAIRFVNWMNNQTVWGWDPDFPFYNETELGAYVIPNELNSLGEPIHGETIERYVDPEGAAYPIFVLPTVDEWYKAAYHDALAGEAGLYFRYANGSNVPPVSDQPWQSRAGANYFNDDGLANSFNNGYARTGAPTFSDVTLDPLTNVGSYSSAISTYGTFDQTGSVAEWTETGPDVLPPPNAPVDRKVIGTHWDTRPENLGSDSAGLIGNGAASSFLINSYYSRVGFRVAALSSYFDDFKLTVQYATPSVVEGPLVEGFDPLPTTITAEFMIEDVALDDYTVGLDQVTDFHLSGAPFGMTTAMDLDSFYLELDATTREPRTLNWGAENQLQAGIIIIGNNNFQLSIRGTDGTTQQPFRYFWSTSTNTFEKLSPPTGLSADFDDSGAVDAADLAIWRNAFGATPAGDANADGVTDGADLLAWQRELSAPAAQTATAVVPEPATPLLALLATACYRPVRPATSHGSRRRTGRRPRCASGRDAATGSRPT